MNEMKLKWCPLYEDSLKDTLREINPDLSNRKIKEFYSKEDLDRKLKIKEPFYFPINLLNHSRINPIYQGDSVDILNEDEYFIALNKPSQVHCHPLKYNESNNILSFLSTIKKYCPLLRINKGNYDRSLLYRLDFDTSGLVLFCKNESLFQKLRASFRSEVKKKEYYALVEGHFDELGLHEHSIKPSGPKGSIMKEAEENEERSFKASLEILEAVYNDQTNRTLLKIKLNSGHRHQIRIQLNLLGFPIIGDRIYGDYKFDRLMLHAYKYEVLVDGTVFAYSSPLPKNFKKN